MITWVEFKRCLSRGGMSESDDARRGLTLFIPFMVITMLFVLFSGQIFFSALRSSPTADETLYIGSGYSYYKTGQVVLCPEHPTLVKYLVAFPLLFQPEKESDFSNPGWQQDPPNQFYITQQIVWSRDVPAIMPWTRLPILLLSMGLFVLIARMSWSCWGPRGAMLSAGLCAFCPNLITHGRYGTMDQALAFFMLLTIAAFWNYQRRRNWRASLLVGVSLGLTLAAKFSGVVMLPVLGILLFLDVRPWKAERPFVALWKNVLQPYGVWLVTAYLLVWFTYLCPSDPLFYLRGMLMVNENHNPDIPSYMDGVFYLGQIRGYFVKCFLYKTPDAVLLLLLVWAMIMVLRKHRANGRELSLLFAPLLLWGLTEWRANPLGLRYLLPVYPFLYVSMGRLALLPGRIWAGVLICAIAWMGFESIQLHPNQQAYFNRLSGGVEAGPYLLSDSNLEWGEGLPQLRDYLDENDFDLPVYIAHPWDADLRQYGIDLPIVSPREWSLGPDTGVYIINVSCLIGGLYSAQTLHVASDWMRRYKPLDKVGTQYWVFAFRDGDPLESLPLKHPLCVL